MRVVCETNLHRERGLFYWSIVLAQSAKLELRSTPKTVCGEGGRYDQPAVVSHRWMPPASPERNGENGSEGRRRRSPRRSGTMGNMWHRDADFFEAFLADLLRAFPQAAIKEPFCLMDVVSFGHLFARFWKRPGESILTIRVLDFVELWPPGAHGPPDLLERTRAKDIFFVDDPDWFDAVVAFLRKQLDQRNGAYPPSYLGVWPLGPAGTFCAQTEKWHYWKTRSARVTEDP